MKEWLGLSISLASVLIMKLTFFAHQSCQYSTLRYLTPCQHVDTPKVDDASRPVRSPHHQLSQLAIPSFRIFPD